MTIFVLIPVHNRAECTRNALACLRAQSMADQIQVVVIDDGSTDETPSLLANSPGVIVVHGDGNLWWGGAIQAGLNRVLPSCGKEDYILFLNNDISFAPTYVETLVQVSRENADAPIGSAIAEETNPTRLTSIGARVNVDAQATSDILNELSENERRSPAEIYRVDALSGRGSLFPAWLFQRFGQMRPKLLPHYYADYEVSMRFSRDARVPLFVSTNARIISPPVYGNDNIYKMSLWNKLFSVRSSANILHRLSFFSLVGTPTQRILAPAKALGLAAAAIFRKARN